MGSPTPQERAERVDLAQNGAGVRAQIAQQIEQAVAAAQRTRAVLADWLIDELCRAAELEFRADARAALKQRIESALNPELPFGA